MAQRPLRDVPAEHLAMYRAIVGGDMRGRREPSTQQAPPAKWKRRARGVIQLALARFKEGLRRLTG